VSRARIHPVTGTVRLRARELMRRPVVAVALLAQSAVLIAVDLVDVVGRDGDAEQGRDLVLLGLRVVAAPGGLVFGVLAAAVVGSEFTWSTERALLARDPRRGRFVALQLVVTATLALAWWVVQSLFAVGLGFALQLQAGPDPAAAWRWAANGRALAAVGAVTLVYGLVGAACAIAARGALAGVVAVLAYGLLGELGLAPLWHPVDDWTLWTSATRLVVGQGDPVPGQSLVVVAAVGLLALSASFTFYAGREITR